MALEVIHEHEIVVGKDADRQIYVDVEGVHKMCFMRTVDH